MHFINIVHELYLIVLERTWVVVFADFSWVEIVRWCVNYSHLKTLAGLDILSILTWVVLIFGFLLRAQLRLHPKCLHVASPCGLTS